MANLGLREILMLVTATLCGRQLTVAQSELRTRSRAFLELEQRRQSL